MSFVSARFYGDDLAVFSVSTRLISVLKKASLPFYVNEKRGFIQIRPMDYFLLRHECEKQGIQVELSPHPVMNLQVPLNPSFILHDYQQEAMASWKNENQRGIVVLPTGSGKSFVGLSAIASTNLRALVVVPTLALVDQWIEKIETHLGIEREKIGQLGGGKQKVEEITVATYDSASLYLRTWRSLVGLLIFDEVHHLVGKSYRIIGEGSLAMARLGLTATLPEDKNARQVLFDLVGPLILEYKPADLKGSGRIADYELKTIEISLTDDQRREYEKLLAPFRQYLREKKLGRNAFQKMIYRMNQDPQARAALTAYQRARLFVFNLPSKLDVVEKLLDKHLRQGDQVLIFSESVSFVEHLSRTFLIPMIVHHTPPSEREWLLDQFKKGKIRVLASGKVLDEGIDVPSANVGIIISGSGQKRQFIQRLGRILRKKSDNRPAILYDIVIKDSTEERLARKRKKAAI